MPASPSAIRFLYPACHQVLRAAVPMGGRATECPVCGLPLAVPPASAAPHDTVEMAVDTLTLAQLRDALAD